MNKNIRDRWKTRRMMVLIAFWDLILTLPVAALLYKLKWIDAAFITAISGVAIGVVTAIAALVSTYFGAAAYDDVNYQKNDDG